MTFNWPIVGHGNIKKFLQKSIIRGKLAQGYLFYGPEMVGKMQTARAFAQSLLCENYRTALSEGKDEQTAPCRVCPACRQFQKNIYPDFFLVEREANEKTGKKRNEITVAQIRELLSRITKRAFSNSFKIVIIPEAEALSEEASNCLLKILEEPPGRTIFLLISLTKEALLPTVLSRLQAFRFLAVPWREIYEELLRKGAERSLALELAKIAEGRPTLAMKLFSDGEQYQKLMNERRELIGFFQNSIVGSFQLIEKMTVRNKDVDLILGKLDALEVITRDALLTLLSDKEMLVNKFLTEELMVVAKQRSISGWQEYLSRIEEAKEYVRANVSPRLVFENLVL
jgi:DNA polymerase-3 subunit delta'